MLEYSNMNGRNCGEAGTVINAVCGSLMNIWFSFDQICWKIKKMRKFWGTSHWAALNFASNLPLKAISTIVVSVGILWVRCSLSSI